MMDEKDFHENLEKYIDGELDEQARSEMDKLIADNPVFAMEVEREKNFNNLLKQHLFRKEAPYELREKVIDSLQKDKSGIFDLSWIKPFMRPAGIGFITVLILIGLWSRSATVFPVFAESITRHTDCLKGVYSMEILTNDPQEVAKWFQGKLEFAVNPPDLSKHNAKLVGARLCHLADKKVAFLTYEHEGRQISAFILDVRDMKVPDSKRMDTPTHKLYAKSDMGYQSILCLNKQVQGVGCIFVSDIPQDELLQMII